MKHQINRQGSLEPKLIHAGILLLFFFTAILVSSCEHDENNLCDPTPVLDLNVFADNLHDMLTEPMQSPAGYQFAINQNGTLIYSEAGGQSVYADDPGGPVDMTVNTRLNVASVSKFIGTIALMQVLEKHNIDIEELVYDHLPSRWKLLAHSDHYDAGSAWKITIRNLLRMETCLAFPSGSSWTPGRMSTTQEMLMAWSSPADPQRYGVYQNGNFTLIRVLIGELEYGLDETAADYNEQTADAYFDYIKTNIFDKLNLSPPMSTGEVNDYYNNTNFTNAYQYPFDASFQDSLGNVGWAPTSDPSLNGGSGGLVLNAIDLAKVLAYFMHENTGLIISPAMRNIVIDDTNLLGLLESPTGDHGIYPSKGGTRGPDSYNRSIRSRIMIFPQGVEAVLLVNSDDTGIGSKLADAYDDAWVNPCN